MKEMYLSYLKEARLMDAYIKKLKDRRHNSRDVNERKDLFRRIELLEREQKEIIRDARDIGAYLEAWEKTEEIA